MHSDAASNRFRLVQNRNGVLILFDDNFRTRSHMCQKRRDVRRGGFGFREINNALRHIVSILPATPVSIFQRLQRSCSS